MATVNEEKRDKNVPSKNKAAVCETWGLALARSTLPYLTAILLRPGAHRDAVCDQEAHRC
jgi:hypothetical protein